MKKGVLKNEYKYTEHLKLAKGLIIDQASTEHRDNLDVGISSRNFGKNWYILPKGKAIFKTYDSYKKFENIKQIRIINELLCYELAKQVNIPCAEYELATNNNVTGLVTYKITNDNEILVKGQDFLLFANGEAHNDMISYSRACKYYKELGFKIDRKKIMLDLYKIAVFDALTLQTDRHMNNICFIKNTKDDTIRVSPIIDNELAFLADVCFEHFNSVNDIDEVSLKGLHEPGRDALCGGVRRGGWAVRGRRVQQVGHDRQYGGRPAAV